MFYVTYLGFSEREKKWLKMNKKIANENNEIDCENVIEWKEKKMAKIGCYDGPLLSVVQSGSDKI